MNWCLPQLSSHLSTLIHTGLSAGHEHAGGHNELVPHPRSSVGQRSRGVGGLPLGVASVPVWLRCLGVACDSCKFLVWDFGACGLRLPPLRPGNLVPSVLTLPSSSSSSSPLRPGPRLLDALEWLIGPQHNWPNFMPEAFTWKLWQQQQQTGGGEQQERGRIQQGRGWRQRGRGAASGGAEWVVS